MPAGDTPNLVNDLILPSRATVSEIREALFAEKKVSVQMLRLDQADPLLSGNKTFKLVPNLLDARAAGFDTVLSFGGAYSNHIHALAEAGHRFRFNTIGVIRGDDGQADTHTLRFASARGMRLIRVSRQEYRRRNDIHFIQELSQSLGNFYWIPEGGANEPGMRGCMHLASVITESLRHQDPGQGRLPDEILLACGTGTTLAGLIAGIGDLNVPGSSPSAGWLPFVRGIAVLKQGEFLNSDVSGFLARLNMDNTAAIGWGIETGYHWGGYARFPGALATFMHDFEQTHGILLDPVYTAKVVSAVYQRIAAGCYPPGTRLLLLHTGGLQGRALSLD